MRVETCPDLLRRWVNGDVMTAGIATDDGAPDLGLQRTPVEPR